MSIDFEPADALRRAWIARAAGVVVSGFVVAKATNYVFLAMVKDSLLPVGQRPVRLIAPQNQGHSLTVTEQIIVRYAQPLRAGLSLN